MVVPPLVMEPEELERRIGDRNLLIIDLSAADSYARYHIPGAVHLEYAELTREVPPVTGLLAEAAHLITLFSRLGISTDTHVVAYDDEGGAKAARLLWTLDVAGHPSHSLLNGGSVAWMNEGHPVNNQSIVREPADYSPGFNETPIADRDYILHRLGDAHTVLLDVRSPAEFRGEVRRAARGGHIPGAINIEWTRAVDGLRNQRLKPEGELRALYESADVTPDKEIIVYCHSHRRSAHTYIVLKSLGYARVKGYPGSWSDWANAADAPIPQ